MVRILGFAVFFTVALSGASQIGCGHFLSKALGQETQFVMAFLTEPDNWDTRLVYADWLEEQGAPTRLAQAHAIRLAHQMEIRSRWWHWFLGHPQQQELQRWRGLAGWDDEELQELRWELVFQKGIPVAVRTTLYAPIAGISHPLFQKIPTVTSVVGEGWNWQGYPTQVDLPLEQWAYAIARDFAHPGACAILALRNS